MIDDRRTPGERLYSRELGGLNMESPTFWQLPTSKRDEYERRARDEPTAPMLAAIRAALTDPARASLTDPWAALRACVAELDAREADSRELHGQQRYDGEDGVGQVVVRLDAPLLVRFAILRQQLSELGKLARSFTLDEQHQLAPHARRLVLLIDCAIDQYRAEEERAGRQL